MNRAKGRMIGLIDTYGSMEGMPFVSLSSFLIHEAGAFPIVRLRGDQTRAPGYSSAWCREMDLLIAKREQFVLVYTNEFPDESHDDRVARGLWLKSNKEKLAELCLAFIIVEPDPDRRAGMETAFSNRVRAFGTPQATRATEEEARDLARHLLAAAHPSAT